MAAFVLDASVAIAGIAPDEYDDLSVELMARVFAENAAVPAIWHYEVINILTLKRRRDLISEIQYQTVLNSVATIPVECDALDIAHQCKAASGLAIRHSLSVYDAAYLELAQRRNLPLATLDKRLASSALAAGISVLPQPT